MKKAILLLLFIAITCIGNSQNIEGFDGMCGSYIKGTVPTVTAKELKVAKENKSDIVILDSREKNEFNTSHIPDATYIGFNKFKVKQMTGVSKNAPIYVYCSIGYRSEKVGEQLQKAGYTNVFNVYGGIFSWGNSGYPLVDDAGNSTEDVHGYNKKWSKWLNEEQCNPVVD